MGAPVCVGWLNWLAFVHGVRRCQSDELLIDDNPTLIFLDQETL